MAAAARSRGGRRHGAIVGVDVGGTTTAVGLVTPDGDVIADASAPTRAGERDPLETIVGLMAEVTERAGRAARAIAAAGVGVPGPVDAERGIVGDPVTHVAELAGRPLAAELGGRVGLPDRKSTRLNSSHVSISYAVFCVKTRVEGV